MKINYKHEVVGFNEKAAEIILSYFNDTINHLLDKFLFFKCLVSIERF
jgi:hypothetical protein